MKGGFESSQFPVDRGTAAHEGTPSLSHKCHTQQTEELELCLSDNGGERSQVEQSLLAPWSGDRDGTTATHESSLAVKL